MARRRSAVLVAVVVLLATGACGGGGSKGAGGDKALTFGAALSLTGSLSREGVLTREGYEYCTKVVNDKGGLKVGDTKYKLAITYQDDTSTPDTAANLIDQFNDQGKKFILGPYGSASTSAAAAAVERNGQVMVDSAGADNTIFTKGYRNTFAVLSPATEYLSSIVKAIAELAQPKPKTVAIISADDGFSKTAAAAGGAEVAKQGMTLLGTEFVPNGTTDVSAALTKLRGKKPDVILGSVHLAEGIAIVKQSAELGVKPAGFGETVAPPTPDFVTTLGAAAEGVLGSSQWTIETKGSDDWFGSAQDYDRGFKAKYSKNPEYHNAEATAACLALVDGIKKAGTLDAAKVRDAVAALKEPSFFGPIQFDDTGKNVTKQMSVVQIQGGKAVTVWPKGAGTGTLRWPAR